MPTRQLIASLALPRFRPIEDLQDNEKMPAELTCGHFFGYFPTSCYFFLLVFLVEVFLVEVLVVVGVVAGLGR